jgi:hypothetical protein
MRKASAGLVVVRVGERNAARGSPRWLSFSRVLRMAKFASDQLLISTFANEPLYLLIGELVVMVRRRVTVAGDRTPPPALTTAILTCSSEPPAA